MMERKKGKHLTHSERIKMETMLNMGHTVMEVARYIGCTRQTVYNEIKRGTYMHRNSDYTESERYSSDIGQERHQYNVSKRGKQLKIGKDYELAHYIENKIADENYSPEAVLLEIKVKGLKFNTEIKSHKTIYRYIDMGVFLNLTNKNLPVKGKRKRKINKVRTQKRASAGTSIEVRPKAIDTREEFGNWEMDTVKGKKGKSKANILVLTERKTRNELVFKMPDGCASSVVEALDRLEQRWGEMFKNVFKTITVDNGVEFADSAGMERSCRKSGEKRTKLYYCHPYSSYERASNECQNRLVRRFVPKGTDFDDVPSEQIESIGLWMNNYPRRQFDGQTSKQLFDKCIAEIINEVDTSLHIS